MFQAVTNMLRPLRHAHSGVYLGGGHFAMLPPFELWHKEKSANYTLKSRNQIIIKHACGKGLRYLAF